MTLTTLIKCLIALAFFNSLLLITAYFVHSWAAHYGHWSEDGWLCVMIAWGFVKFGLIGSLAWAIVTKLSRDQ